MSRSEVTPGPASTGAAGPASRGARRARRTLSLLRWLTAEHLAVLALALAVLAVHDVGYILRLSYWTDEDWVALTARFPLSQLRATTSSTPIGWSLLVRACTVSGTQDARLVPLAFAAAAVAAAYWLARGLDWPRRDVAIGAGLLAGTAALLVPAMLIRDDLKQYTADAFFALLALALTARLDRRWSRPGLLALSVVTWGGMLFSHTVAFVGAAALAGTCAGRLARRAWRQLAEAAVASAVTAALMLAVYKAFDAAAVMPALTYSPHFINYYPPLHSGLRAFLAFFYQAFAAQRAYFGLGPSWLVVALYVAGVAAAFRRGRPATGVALALLWPEMALVSAVRLYPFLDTRTSTFLFAVTAVVAATGVAWLCSLARPYLKGALAAGLAAAAVAGFALMAAPFVRAHLIPGEGMAAVTRYLAGDVPSDDVILVALDSNFGFAYYWQQDQPARMADSAIIQGYEAYYPGQPRIVVAASRAAAGVDAALDRALAQSRQRGCTPIWLVRTHVTAAEQAAYDSWLSQRQLSAVAAGPRGLTEIRLPACSVSRS